MPTLRYFCIFLFMLYCNGMLMFDCPEPVGYGESSILTCLNLKEGTGSIRNPSENQVTTCIGVTCHVFSEFNDKLKASVVNDTILLTVHKVNLTDEGEWTCWSWNGNAKCSLNVYKLPSCKIRNFTSEISHAPAIGQDLPLNIDISDYYCTNSITWNLQIGGKSQNITEFWELEQTHNITNRVVTYSSTVTSSLTGHVELSFNCNDKTYNVSCSGVEDLKLREPPFCILTSVNDTADLTIGSNLTLQAAIEEYPCTTGIEYALLSGSLMITDFIRRDSLFYATFEVKPVYLDNQLHLKYTCNNVSATTRTNGVEILLRKEEPFKQSINFIVVISLLVGFVVIVIAVLFGILISRKRRYRSSPSNEVSVYNIPSPYNDNEDRYQELKRVVTPHQVQDVDYLTPQSPPDTQNLPNVDYEITEHTEQIQLADRQIGTNILPGEIKNQEYLNAIVERTS